MRAAHITKLEGPDFIDVVEVEDPVPSRGQVVVAVESAGVNFPDLLMSRGLYQMKPPVPFPPGGEVAGTISAVGEGVPQNVGDRVMALTGFGGFASKVLLGADRCVPIPDSMSTELAGAFAFTYATSYHALKDRAHLAPGEKLLVLGAAGGVGSSAVEVGRVMGAEVIAAASTEDKLDFCEKLGAKHRINYATEDLKARAKAIGGGAVDVVYDPVGGPYSEQALRALGYDGRHLVIGFAAGEIPRVPWNLPLLKQCCIIGVAWGAWAMQHPQDHVKNMEQLLAWHSEGALKPEITKKYPLEEAAQALRDMDARKVRGKVVVVP
jgi:NADPH2:quinone reductase